MPSVSDNVSCINILQVWRPSGGDGFSIAANFTATLAGPFAEAAISSPFVRISYEDGREIAVWATARLEGGRGRR